MYNPPEDGIISGIFEKKRVYILNSNENQVAFALKLSDNGLMQIYGGIEGCNAICISTIDTNGVCTISSINSGLQTFVRKFETQYK
jgi:hypothetical protein